MLLFLLRSDIMKLRRLKSNERRYISKSGKKKIYKAKKGKTSIKQKLENWKKNKTYNKKLRAWEFKIEFKKEIKKIENNEKILITLYEYDYTNDDGKNLELDIIAETIVPANIFKSNEERMNRMMFYLDNILRGINDDGLASLIAGARNEGKVGIEYKYTDEPLKDFDFTRFEINKKDFLTKIKEQRKKAGV